MSREMVTAPELASVGVDVKTPCLSPPTWRVLSFRPRTNFHLGKGMASAEKGVLAGL